MPVWKMQCSFQMDTLFPRDRLVITPHFDDAGALTDPQGLADDLAAGLAAWHGRPIETMVRAYDAQGTPPVFPQGEAIIGAGTMTASPMPREVALCLSFYSERNLPRQRGRLFIPAGLGSGFGAAGVRPVVGQQNFVSDLVAIFTGLGGADVDWTVYSPTDDVARSVTNWWVDNEWDTIRSRGLRGDDRIVGTTSEG